MPGNVNSVPRVSVIVPSYNTANLIAASLDSVLQQSFQDFEIIVVNDGSPDTAELEKVLQNYRERIVYIKQENKRAGGARNTAIRRAQGELLAFLDSDDVWLPDHLASQVALFDQDASLDLVYCNCLSVGDPTRAHEFMSRCPSNGSATFEALILERCQIPVSTVVARKAILMKAGLFDEKLARCDDYDMWVRAAFHGAKIGYTGKVQAKLNGGRPGALGSSRSKMAEAYWQILEKIRQTLPLSASERDLVEKRAARIHAHYLLEQGKEYLREKRFSEARKSLAEANHHLRRLKITFTLLGLSVAPIATGKLFSLFEGTRS